MIPDWIAFIFVFFFATFLFFDEEPLFDQTDWNITHVYMFIFCVCIVIWDNLAKGSYGQFVFKDQTLVFITFSVWFSLENYMSLIIIIFCFHCLTPLELELIELVEIYQALLSWYTINILPMLLLLLLFFIVLIFINFCFNWFNWRVIVTLVFFMVLGLVVNMLYILWDFLFVSLTGYTFNANPNNYYNHSSSNISYELIYQNADMFDWHMSQPEQYVMRFEDLYLFSLQLFNIVALYSCVFVFIMFFLDLLLSGESGCSSSVTFLGICCRWLDHALWCFAYSHLAIILVSLSCSMSAFELGIWFF